LHVSSSRSHKIGETKLSHTETPIRIKNLFGWEVLKSINDNKIVKSSYVWLVVVPFVAKLTSKLENTLSLNLAGKIYSIDLTLPFSWQLFFISALAFVMGNIIVLIFCPRIIKDYSNANEFIATGLYQGELYRYMNSELRMMYNEHTANVARLEEMKEEHGTTGPKLDVNTLRNDAVTQQFWMIYNYYLKKNTLHRKVAVFFYAIGFISFSIVAINNVAWVYPQLSIANIWAK